MLDNDLNDTPEDDAWCGRDLLFTAPKPFCPESDMDDPGPRRVGFNTRAIPFGSSSLGYAKSTVYAQCS